MEYISDIEIEASLGSFGISTSPELFRQIRTYISLLTNWNKKVSLTSITSVDDILKFHFAESIFAVSAVPIVKGRLADVGTGPGFPGIPLRMAVTGLQLSLIEPNSKKSAFLSEVVRELHLSDVEVFRGRMDEFEGHKNNLDYVTSRALGQYEHLLQWSREHLSKDGKIVLWLGENDARRISQIPGWDWRPPISVPSSDRRCLLVGDLRSG